MYVPRQTPQTTKKDTATMQFGNIRGVDFRSDETESYRSPNSVNMYRTKLGLWETHPGFRKIGEIGDDIHDIYKFTYTDKYGDVLTKVIIHAGTSMYLWENYPETFTKSDLIEIYDGLPERKCRYAEYKNNLLIATGNGYYCYNGDSFALIEKSAFVPQTWTGKTPDASEGSAYQQRNFLTPYFIEGFTADGTTKEFKLSVKDLDEDTVECWYMSNGEKKDITGFTVDYANGKVTFNTAPPKVEIAGVENLFIKAPKTSKGYANKINNCTEILIFDDRVFLTGNKEYPNTIFWSGNGDFTYFGEIMFSDKAGTGSSPIVAMQLLSDSKFLTIKKDSAQDGTYAVWTPTAINDNYIAEFYTAATASSNIGCLSEHAHKVFIDDNVFLSSTGLKAISRNLSISLERNVEHRSTLVDSRLLNEDLEKAVMEQFDGRLYILFPNGHCYIADSSIRTSRVSDFTEYEWAYLEDIGVYSGQELVEDTYVGGEFQSPTMLKAIGKDELFFGANGTLCKFNFDMKYDADSYDSKAFNFNGRAINDFVDTSFSWFGASNRFKRLIRKYNDLYCKTKSRTKIQVLFRTEKSHITNSKVLDYKSIVFNFADIDFANFDFNTLTASSFVMRKLKAKLFRRLQIRIRSAGVNNQVAFDSLIVDAYILTKKLK